MIEIVIVRDDKKIIEFYGSGHSGYDEIGKDIICAAVSTSMQQTVVGITGYLNIEPDIKVEDGFLHVKINSINNKGVDVLLETMYITLLQLEEQYTGYLKIIEKEVKTDVQN